MTATTFYPRVSPHTAECDRSRVRVRPDRSTYLGPPQSPNCPECAAIARELRALGIVRTDVSGPPVTSDELDAATELANV